MLDYIISKRKKFKMKIKEKSSYMKKLVFYKCPTCGNVVVKLVDKRVPVVCCGAPMKELTPNTVDAAEEKHVPVVNINGNVVNVEIGSVEHPMIEAHYITHIVIETNLGHYVRVLNPNDKPSATYYLAEGETVETVYEYCNLHGLWSVTL